MELVTLQTMTAEVREETMDDVVYLVAPVVAVRAGVLNGALLTVDELHKVLPAEWDDIPIPIGHPMRGEENIPATDIETIEANVCGRFYKARYVDDKLKGELWIDIAKALSLGGDATRAVEALRAGEPVEVSTGYFCDLEERSGSLNGEPYSAVQRDLRPDHIALLLGAIGACSWADGCGAPRVNEQGAEMLQTLLRKDESYREREEDVLAAIREKFVADDDSWAYVADLYEDSAVYALGSTDEPEQHFQVGYTAGDDGITFTGDPVAVEREITYTVLQAQAEEHEMAKQATNQCEGGIIARIKRILGVNDMSREEQEATLKARGVEDSVIEGTTDEQLAWMVEHTEDAPPAAPSEPVDDEDTDESGDTEDTGDTPGDTAPAVNENTEIGGVKLGEIAKFITERKADTATEKAGLVASLVANERCTVSQGALEAMDVSGLKELVANFTPGNFTGMGLPRGSVQPVPPAPSIVLAKAGE